MLGLQQVRNLTLANSVMKVFKGVPEDFVTMKSFWSHSLATAMTAQLLAGACGNLNAERLFVAGLLHDVGQLVIFARLPEEANVAIRSSRTNCRQLYQCERETLGYDHAMVARLLLEAWLFPTSLVEAVGCHHAPTAARVYPAETAIVHLADVVVHAIEWGSSGEMLVPSINSIAVDRLNISPTVLQPIVQRVERDLAELVEVLFTEDK
jgi:putative nucleotidyltransferase with HDIG domain